MEEPGALTILICDSSEIVCSGLEHILSSEARIRILGWSRNAQAAIEDTARLDPDIIIVDIDLPGAKTGELIGNLKAASPQVRFILLKDPFSPTPLTPDIWPLVNAICSKSVPPSQLVRAIVAVADGAAWLDGDIARQALQVLPRADPSRLPGNTRLSNGPDASKSGAV